MIMLRPTDWLTCLGGPSLGDHEPGAPRQVGANSDAGERLGRVQQGRDALRLPEATFERQQAACHEVVRCSGHQLSDKVQTILPCEQRLRRLPVANLGFELALFPLGYVRKIRHDDVKPFPLLQRLEQRARTELHETVHVVSFRIFRRHGKGVW